MPWGGTACATPRGGQQGAPHPGSAPHGAPGLSGPDSPSRTACKALTPGSLRKDRLPRKSRSGSSVSLKCSLRVTNRAPHYSNQDVLRKETCPEVRPRARARARPPQAAARTAPSQGGRRRRRAQGRPCVLVGTHSRARTQAHRTDGRPLPPLPHQPFLVGGLSKQRTPTGRTFAGFKT